MPSPCYHVFATALTLISLLELSIARSWSESISAQGLLGSHFGIPGLNASFDYVVVGGGTAGLTIANRLAQASPSSTVAVVEAGDFYQYVNGNYSEVPAYASDFTGSLPAQKNPLLDWYMYTQPQAALDGVSLLYDSGKVLGGSSARNFLWYVRGTKGAHKKWANEVGDDSYSFSNLLPYYKNSVKFNPPDNSQRPANASVQFDPTAFASKGGPLNLSYASWVNPISAWLGKSMSALGLREIRGFSSGHLLGWSYLPQELEPNAQTRDSSQTSFLQQSLLETENLIVYKSALARRILFNEHKRAEAVLVQAGNMQYQISASREIIVSAGVFRSPQLLMASGIGPSATLKALKIPVIYDNPGVGQNLHDNVLVGASFGVKVTTHSALADPSFASAAVAEYNKARTGILTNVGGDLAGFQKFPDGELSNATARALRENFPSDWPHIEYLVLDAYFGDGRDSSSPVPPFQVENATNFVGASVSLTATFSRGNVTIQSQDTSVNPLISPNWLLDPRDQELAVAAFKQSRKLFSTDVIAPIVAGEAYPGANITSDADILKVCRSSANSVYHACCTCKMGRDNDSTAVVDSHARVYGVEGLRVVDASSLPFLLPGHPSSTIYMLAEKISDDILSADN